MIQHGAGHATGNVTSPWCKANQAGASIEQRGGAPGQADSADACTMSQCAGGLAGRHRRIAFDARPAGAIANGFPGAPTLKVLTLCDASLPTAATAAGHKKIR